MLRRSLDCVAFMDCCLFISVDLFIYLFSFLMINLKRVAYVWVLSGNTLIFRAVMDELVSQVLSEGSEMNSAPSDEEAFPVARRRRHAREVGDLVFLSARIDERVQKWRNRSRSR